MGNLQSGLFPNLIFVVIKSPIYIMKIKKEVLSDLLSIRGSVGMVTGTSSRRTTCTDRSTPSLFRFKPIFIVAL